MKKLPANIKTVWRLRLCIKMLIELGLGVVIGIIIQHYNGPYWPLYILGGLMLVQLMVSWALIPYNYAFHQYAIYDDRVEIQSGFIFRKQNTIPIARIQNVNLHQGPLLTYQHLNEISIDTASDSHTIDAVTYDEAQLIRNRVMHLAMEARNAV